MIPRKRRSLAPFAALGVAIVAVVGCDTAMPSFDPAGPCVTDGRVAGAYPALEAMLPKEFVEPGASAAEHRAPTSVDSGRNCTPDALGTLAQHGVTELRFAGATWDEGDGAGTVSAIFVTPDGQPKLDYRWMEEFYSAGVYASNKTENIQESRPTIDPAGPVFRLDALNDLSFQSLVVWPSGSDVRIVIVATRVQPGASRAEHDDRVNLAVSQSAIENPR